MPNRQSRVLVFFFLLLAVLYFALRPGPTSQALVTAPATPFALTAAGDYGTSGEAASSFQMIGAAAPVFNLALGDMSYNSRPESEWCQFVKDNINIGAGKPAGDPFGETFPFQLVTGNHEDEHVGGDDGFIDNFAACLPDRLGVAGIYGHQYYFDYPAGQPLARFILIDPDLNRGRVFQQYCQGGETANCNWLRDRIGEAKAQGLWVIVGMHKVCITMGAKSCEIGSGLMNLLISEGVDLVLQGHDHNYQRSKQLTCVTVDSYDSACVADDGADGVYNRGAGTVFVIVGTGGQKLYTVHTSDSEAGYFASWMGQGSNSRHGLLNVTVSASGLSAQFVGSTAGNFADSFVLVAPTPPDTPTPTPTITPGGPTLTPTATATAVPGSTPRPGRLFLPLVLKGVQIQRSAGWR